MTFVCLVFVVLFFFLFFAFFCAQRVTGYISILLQATGTGKGRKGA